MNLFNKFYDEFKKLIELLKNKITGIPEEKDRQWYSSVIVNRILFIYFIQHKELLGNRDKLYLSRHLKEFAKKKKDVFYKEFLTPLFLEGLSKKDRVPATEQLLESVPYLNGGLFQKHILEKENIGIQIPDVVFEKIFQYLDTWNWHLDEKHDTEENEINPEVLGYIFEKLINQKQMGAYYTKEDITGYISKNTIIPRLLDMVKEKAPQFFEGKQSIFQEIFQNPDLFIYNSIQFGIHNYNVLDQDGRVTMDIVKRASSSQMKDVDQDGRVTTKALPEEIEVGIKDVSKRTEWNKVAEPDYALPTETWREVVARRQRYFETKSNLEKGLGADGKLNFQTNDLITHNLNIIDFILHTIRNTGNIQFVELFYEALQKVTILDPTCGSGAFLFSALNILEDLYEVCLDRLPKEKEKINTKYHMRYHIYKTIILNNLYGVDIMEEAVEICQLRLFLKLISQVERQDDLPNFGIEPLPDIDFNILSGNTLVGFTNIEQVSSLIQKEQLQTNPPNEDSVLSLEKIIKEKKQIVNEKLNLYLAKVYGVNIDKPQDYQNWKESHKPFHWVTEFYSIFKNGGFDVIIGNPPYIEYSKVKKEYTILGYETEKCRNLYAYAIERSSKLLNSKGNFGMIVPSSATSTGGYLSLQKILLKQGNIFISSFSDQRGKLFDIPHPRLCIILFDRNTRSEVFTTQYLKLGNDSYRRYLFERIKYLKLDELIEEGRIPRIESKHDYNILKKIRRKKNVHSYIQKSSEYKVYYTRKISWYIQALDFIPKIYDSNKKLREPSELKEIAFINRNHSLRYFSLLNSSLFYWFITTGSDCRNLNSRETNNFPIELEDLNLKPLEEIANELSKDIQKNSEMKDINFASIGKLSIQCIYPSLSKPIIDEIDKVLALHYGFTEEELDYIINYDIKYRR